jgi:hypothetical protein
MIVTRWPKIWTDASCRHRKRHRRSIRLPAESVPLRLRTVFCLRSPESASETGTARSGLAATMACSASSRRRRIPTLLSFLFTPFE